MKSAVVTVVTVARATSIDWKFMIYEESHVALMILSIKAAAATEHFSFTTDDGGHFLCVENILLIIYLMSVHVCVVVVVGSCDTMNFNTSKTK